MERWKVDIIWHGEDTIEILINDRTAWKREDARGVIAIQDFLLQLEELDYITLRSHEDTADYLASVKQP
jgi:hypothetical protein